MTSVQSSPPQQADRLSRSLLSQITSQLLKLVVAVAIGGWLARYLGPTSLGQLTYVMALLGLLGPLGSLGAKGGLAALLCEPHPLPGLVSTAFGIELLGTGLLSACLLPWIVVEQNPTMSALILAGIVANLFASAEVFEAQLLNQHRGIIVGKIAFFKVVFGAICTLIALVLRAPLLAFGSISALQNAVGALLLTKEARAPGVRRLIAEFNTNALSSLLARGLPLFLTSIAIMFYMKSDQVMLQWLRGSGDVGQYSVAVRLAECFYFVPIILAETFTPRISNSGALNHGFVQDSLFELNRFYRLSWLTGMGLMLASLLVFPLLIVPVFGQQYSEAKPALMCLSFSTFAACTGCASGSWLTVNDQTWLYAQRSLFGALLNIILNLFMIPPLGIVGAALATSMAHFAAVYVYPMLFSATRGNTLKLLFPW